MAQTHSEVWCNQTAGVILGHCRLTIIDLSANGNQPMHSHDGRYTIVYNGEIYNFGKIRTDLEHIGHVFYGQSDTEVILVAIQQWGLQQTLKRLAGMFAFGLWDNREQTLYLVRDRLGIKPLYYQIVEDSIIFASELKPLIQHPKLANKSINRDALSLYMQYLYVPTPHTIFENIYKLPPATTLTIKIFHSTTNFGILDIRGGS